MFAFFWEVEDAVEGFSGECWHSCIDDLSVLLGEEGNRAFRNIHEKLQFQVCPRSVGDNCLETILAMNDKFLNLFFYFQAIIFVMELIIGIEESMVDQNTKLSMIIYFLDFLNKNEECRFGTNHEVLSLVLNFKVSNQLAWEEACSSCVADLILQIHKTL